MSRIRALLVAMMTVLATAMLLAAPSNPAGAVIVGANGRVVFVSNRDGDNEIYAMRSDGTGVVQLTTNTANDTDPGVSADGTAIAFISDRDGGPDLYTMAIDGTNVFRLTTDLGTTVESHPSWAPNASAITFAGLTGTDSEIYSIKPSGTGLLNLTNNTTAFDANPAWSPGGIKIAFDSTNRNGDLGTEVYTMNNDGTLVMKLTKTGKDSNPGWNPDNKNLTFESARDNVQSGASKFADVTKPIGVAVTSTAVLVTQFSTDKVKQINSSGIVSNFATLPASGLSVERYIAVAPAGLPGFPAGYVYATVGQNVYEITPDGLTVTLCVNVPQLPNGETGITFDTVGTFGNKMILTDRRGPIYTVDSCTTPNVTLVTDVGQQIEGPLVAPLSFVPFGGQILVGNEFQDRLFAISSTGVVSIVPDPDAIADSPEGADLIPLTVCNFGTSGRAYFIAMQDMNQILAFPAADFAGLGGDILAPAELQQKPAGITRWHSDGTSVTTSQFYGVLGTPDVEGSDFAPCASQTSARRLSGAALRSANVAGPHEIYKMTSGGLNQVRLTNNTTDDTNPAFSPNKLTIVFQSDRDDPNQPTCEGTATCSYEVYTMVAADGSAQTNISNDLTANDVTPDWQTVGCVVSVSDFIFTPATCKPKQGGAVLWEFFGPSEHTATDNSGMGLFDSGIKQSGEYYVFKFVAAGSYPVICTIHPTMTGTVKVPITAAPLTGDLTTVFTITWAVAAPPTGYNYDIQISRPGGPGFVDWLTNTNAKSGTFVADSGTGVYSFQARIQNGIGAASNYSQPVSITVNP